MLGIVDRDGGGSMGLTFVIGPLVALVCASTDAIAAAVYTRRLSGSAPVRDEDRRRDTTQFALVAGIGAAGFPGHFISKFAFWLAGPVGNDAMWKAWAHALAPMTFMLAGGVAGWFLTLRSFWS